uniref:Peptidase S1 domain-containing protein n=1 Tax=Gongylonema pulchrum TaxID=637853 RepID=A0A183EHC4_9BILA
LSQYKQLALRAREQSMKSCGDVTELHYFTRFKKSERERPMTDCIPSTSQIPPGVPNESETRKSIDEFGLPDVGFYHFGYLCIFKDFGQAISSSDSDGLCEIPVTGTCDEKNVMAAGDVGAQNGFVDEFIGRKRRTRPCKLEKNMMAAGDVGAQNGFADEFIGRKRRTRPCKLEVRFIIKYKKKTTTFVNNSSSKYLHLCK